LDCDVCDDHGGDCGRVARDVGGHGPHGGESAGEYASEDWTLSAAPHDVPAACYWLFFVF